MPACLHARLGLATVQRISRVTPEKPPSYVIVKENFQTSRLFLVLRRLFYWSRVLFFRKEPDARLVARARDGNVEAFNLLVSRWEKRLYNYLLRLLENREDSLDLCQEAFLKAYRRLGTLHDSAKFPQWLFRIAHNLAYSHLRNRTPLERAESWPEEDGEGAVFQRRASAIPIGPARSVSGLELELAVKKALETLTPEQREAIVLKVYHGFRFAEIAEILACPVSTVKSRIYAGFAQLKDILTPHRTAAAVFGRRQ